MNPDEHTIQELFLDVSDGHQLYIHDWGRKSAKTPIIFLHGGPGSQIKDKHRGEFNPLRQRVIFFDQRGCGKSLPYGSLEHNTTQKLVDDIQKIIDKLGLGKVIIRGNSWGSCLALAFALKHPDKVKALVIGGVFTGSQSEIDWLEKGVFRTFFPDVWERFSATVPKNHQDNPSRYHYRRIVSDDELAAKQSGLAYETMEGSVMSLDDRHTPQGIEDYDPSGIRIEMHYMNNRCFMPDRYILENAGRLEVPVYIIQGRYDTVCPPSGAYELQKKLPDAHLYWTLSNHKGEHEDWNIARAIMEGLA